jgi:hypothetical protein
VVRRKVRPSIPLVYCSTTRPAWRDFRKSCLFAIRKTRFISTLKSLSLYVFIWFLSTRPPGCVRVLFHPSVFPGLEPCCPFLFGPGFFFYIYTYSRRESNCSFPRVLKRLLHTRVHTCGFFFHCYCDANIPCRALQTSSFGPRVSPPTLLTYCFTLPENLDVLSGISREHRVDSVLFLPRVTVVQ